ncbi:MAG: hypothetical protein IID13_10505 [Candidatus Marinimicrobia bacterium]|nr:hypothetical protein [Candidatus Neomarinimicrobiota bacterium]
MRPPFTRIVLMALACCLAAQCSRVALEPEDVLDVLANPASSFDPLERLFYAAVTVTPSESGADPDSVWLEMFLIITDTTADTTAVDTPLISLDLLDDATQGDILPGDGVYARRFASGISSGTVGTARFVYYALIGGAEYSLIDSIEVFLPVLSDPLTTMDKLANEMFAAVTVNLTEDDPAPDSVWVELYPASAELIDTLGSAEILLSILLEDFGDNGDSMRADGIYSRRFDSPLPFGTVGSVRFFFLTSLDDRLHTAGDTLILVNRKPEIVAVSASDTLSLPPSGFFTLDTLRVTVSDPDGLGDLRKVSFTTLKPDSTFSGENELLDNGPSGGNGDIVAGDGIYSLIIILGATNATGTYEYWFKAQDLSNAVSDTVIHRVVVQ